MTPKELKLEDIELPQQVKDAVKKSYDSGEHMGSGLTPHHWAKVALLAITRDPVIPSEEVICLVRDGMHITTYSAHVTEVVDRWQRYAFLKRDPELPESVKRLMVEISDNGLIDLKAAREHNEAVIEAYKLGKSEGSAK